jgi:hypothetical protein
LVSASPGGHVSSCQIAILNQLHATLMRMFFHLLLAVLVISGLHSRAWAGFSHELLSYSHAHEHDHPDHGHDCPAPCQSSDDHGSHQDHHHCHFCVTGGLHWIDAKDSSILFSAGRSQLLRICHESQSAPDSPFLSEDKPPLI